MSRKYTSELSSDTTEKSRRWTSHCTPNVSILQYSKQTCSLNDGVAGQNRGKASLEFSEPSNAQTAASHMNGGQLDGSVLKVELSDLPIRTNKARSRSRSPRPPPVARNGPPPRRRRSFSRSPIRSRSRSPGYGRRNTNGNGPRDNGPRNRYPDSYPARPLDRRGPPPRNTYRRSRSRSPPRRNDRAPLPRRRSPSYERGGYGRGPRGRSRSRSYDSLRSSRSRSRTPSRSRSRSRARSYSPYSKASSRSRSRSRSVVRSRSGSRARRSRSKDDIRGSKSRSPP
jgi:RNA-binding protein with serine-rich domain 1